jgi:hypothetical protein
MDAFDASELWRVMTEPTSGPCASIYLPTHAAGEQGQQDPVRLKNLLQQAETQLVEHGMRPAEARTLLQTARDLPRDPVFWQDRSDGLAIFVAPASFRCYRLPITFDEFVAIDHRFHIKPLLPLLTDGERCFVLVLNPNQVRLFRATRYAIQEVVVPGLPANMEQTLNFAETDRGAQVHSAMHGSLGKQAAVFHGQGGKRDRRKDDLEQFFRQVDAALQPLLRDETAPLLLAGVNYLLPIYRAVNSYAYLAEHELVGNRSYLSPHQIHQLAWPLVEPLFRRARDQATAKYCRLAGTGKASADLRTILPAAHEGRIDVLFVDVHATQWGRFDARTATVDVHQQPKFGDADLLDLAAVQTLSHQGTVYSVDGNGVPGGRSVAAVFRY